MLLFIVSLVAVAPPKFANARSSARSPIPTAAIRRNRFVPSPLLVVSSLLVSSLLASPVPFSRLPDPITCLGCLQAGFHPCGHPPPFVVIRRIGIGPAM